MKLVDLIIRSTLSLAFALTSVAASGADYPAPKEDDWVVRDFRFHTGDVLPELRLHYTTVGAPTGEPVLILHGTTGSGSGMLTPAFAGELFGPGQPLDAAGYYIILTDAIGTGKSSKPSDGLRTRWGACRHGSGPRNIRTSWMPRCQWRRCRPRCPAATG